MRKPPPPNYMPVEIPLEMWQRLLGATIRAEGECIEPWELGTLAVGEWLKKNDPHTFPLPATNGYQWKQVFLPNGTLLRTVFNGKNHHCMVEDDALRYNGEITSPSRFANALGGVRRNAWRVIWVMFPNTTEWKLADTLRPPRPAPRRPASLRPAREAPRSGSALPRTAQAPAQACPAVPAAMAMPARAAAEPAPPRRTQSDRRVGHGDRRRLPGAAPAGAPLARACWYGMAPGTGFRTGAAQARPFDSRKTNVYDHEQLFYTSPP